MLTSSQSINYKIDNNGKYLGELKISKFLKDISKYIGYFPLYIKGPGIFD